MNKNQNESDEPRLGRTLINDFRSSDFRRTLRRELKELQEYFLTGERKDRLKQMHRFRKWIYTSAWLLKTMFFKLTPVRRLLLFAGIVFTFIFRNNNNNDSALFMVGVLLILFVLMLEIKDKLLAHSELQAGRAVQIALMPEKSPDVPGWQLWLFTSPANDVGGDLVDYMKISDDRHGLMLGDVAGKGLAAALFSAKLQATLRALLPDVTLLTDLVEKINRITYRDGIPNNFASVVFMEIQSNNPVVRLINAGHIPPLLLSKNGIQELPKGGLALGLSPEAKYNEQQIRVNGDEMLLVYSDGVTEARNEQGDFFGEERLTNLLSKLTVFSPQRAGERILSEITSFIGEVQTYDDISLILMKRQV